MSLAGKTVMPPIVDTHTHLSQTREALTEDLRRRAYYGVSAAMSLGQDAGLCRSRCARRHCQEPRASLRAGRGITMPEPGRTDIPYWITTEAEGRKAVQELAAQKVDIVKIWVDDRNGKYKKLTPELYGADHRRSAQDAACGSRRISSRSTTRRGCCARGSTRSRTGFATGTSTTRSWRCSKQRPNVVVVPNLPDRGVDGISAGCGTAFPPAELQKLQAAQPIARSVQAAFGIQARNLASSCRRRAHRARHRRQHAVGPTRRDGGHGGVGHDAGPGASWQRRGTRRNSWR